MSKNAFVMVTGSRMDVGPVQYIAGALQQEIRVFSGDQCVCVVLATFPAGSPEWEKYHAQGRALDGMPPVRQDSVQSDAAPAGAGS